MRVGFAVAWATLVLSIGPQPVLARLRTVAPARAIPLPPTRPSDLAPVPASRALPIPAPRGFGPEEPREANQGFNALRFLADLGRRKPSAFAMAALPAAEPASPAPPPPGRAARTDAGRGGYASLIAKHAAGHGVPLALADAVVRVESRYNAHARNGPNLGLTQINYRTAQAIGYDGSAAGLYDADTNLHYGIKYLAMAYRLAGGDTCRTVLKYQAGHRAVSMTRAASAYCARVRTMMATK